MAKPDLYSSLTFDLVRELLHEAGYRVEKFTPPQGGTVLRSATGGIAFEVRPGNAISASDAPVAPNAPAGVYGDVVFETAFRVDGELPLRLVNRWNAGRRFGRLYLVDNVLLLDMDMLALGGIARAHMRALVEIWDHLVHECVAYLREELPKPEKTTPTTVSASASASH